MNCSLLNLASVRAGDARSSTQSRARDSASASSSPSSGESTIADEVLISPCAMITPQPALASAAPTSPPRTQPGGDHQRDRVCRVVEPVHEVERERDDDQQRHDEQALLAHAPAS